MTPLRNPPKRLRLLVALIGALALLVTAAPSAILPADAFIAHGLVQAATYPNQLFLE